eukprot:TRINITY_DN27734_c0_g1_i1.p2 TRINITY_DN27734_c0_g1~~TRINITY_DN27734_c0_g1_i1.p2  ORF type:complete len:462 (+),score=114.65 TRINITY_DN27734_c0_g1_i1:66-1451(+)
MACAVGDETGLVKLVDWERAKQPRVRASLGRQDRGEGVAALASAPSGVYAVRRSGAVSHLAPGTAEQEATESAAGEAGAVPVGASAAHYHPAAGRLYCCSQEGAASACSVGDAPAREAELFEVRGPVATACFHCPQPEQADAPVWLAAGGRDNDAAVYLASAQGRPEWRARSLPHDSLGLRRRVHPLAMCFLPRAAAPALLAVGTALQEFRLYDWAEGDDRPPPRKPRPGQAAKPQPQVRASRPLHEFRPEWFGGACVTVMEPAGRCSGGSDTEVFIGDNTGGLYRTDMRSGILLMKYRGGCGAIYSISAHPGGLPFVAHAGLARKLHCHDAKSGQAVSSLFLKQKLTAVQWVGGAAPFADQYTVALGGNAVPEAENEVWMELDAAEQERQSRKRRRGEQQPAAGAAQPPAPPPAASKPLRATAPAPAAGGSPSAGAAQPEAAPAAAGAVARRKRRRLKPQ